MAVEVVKEIVAVPSVAAALLMVIDAALTQFVHEAVSVDCDAVKGWLVTSIELNAEALPETGLKEYVDMTPVAALEVLERLLAY